MRLSLDDLVKAADAAAMASRKVPLEAARSLPVPTNTTGRESISFFFFVVSGPPELRRIHQPCWIVAITIGEVKVVVSGPPSRDTFGPLVPEPQPQIVIGENRADMGSGAAIQERDLSAIYQGIERLSDHGFWDFTRNPPGPGTFVAFATAYTRQVLGALQPYYMGLNSDFYFWLLKESQRKK